MSSESGISNPKKSTGQFHSIKGNFVEGFGNITSTSHDRGLLNLVHLSAAPGLINPDSVKDACRQYLGLNYGCRRN
ncbi:hypothetical protein CYLTODRAFT_427273 [Cylindrobasidium torrendii FP15055 ss-10]|uniref:Uncharacterized protein n=1 Tax=Cylindrobasidium torrendii FP15055 ss-10 TaxID=1314674 RepID=A0A0D7AXA5_9AGAR|nr:hypothetical protein CYLTODRAFT_427273 [Cylindrobasidium torrendii FP15055 ss-10]